MKNGERERFRRLLKTSSAKSQRLMSLLPDTDDVVLVVLKGHLIIEAQLFEILVTQFPDRSHLESARLRFSQLVPLVRAMNILSRQDVWNLCLGINALRNALAHNLEPRDVAARVDTLWKLSQAPSTSDQPTPTSDAERMRQVIARVMGVLLVMDFAKAFSEERDL